MLRGFFESCDYFSIKVSWLFVIKIGGPSSYSSYFNEEIPATLGPYSKRVNFYFISIILCQLHNFLRTAYFSISQQK